MMKSTSTSPAQRLGLATIVISLLAFVLWGALAPLHGAIVSMGLVKPVQNRKLVQHTEGGIIKQIFIKNGDEVQAGQPLIELDDVKTDANAQVLQEMLVFERIRRERLDAEQQLAAHFDLSRESQASFDPAITEKAFQRELKIFRTRRELLEEQLSSYKHQLAAITTEQVALRQQAEASDQANKLAQEELEMNRRLVRDKYISQVRLIGLERTVAEYSAKRGEHAATLAQSEQRKNDISMRMAAVRSEYQRNAAEEFKECHAKFVQLREQLRPVEDAARRKTLTAPVAGKVVGLRVNAPGEVAPPREPLMEIVPQGEDLIVEARVNVDSIRHLHLNQFAELRFTTFNSRITPLVAGKINYISADALTDKDGLPYYVIQVQPQTDSLANAAIPALISGMAAEVYVQLEARSVLNYLLTPVTDVLRHALREP
ncbi:MULTISPECIES: HlyD family type I secretion periplasmic adaptor subunit [Aeromonas]|uniref:HlyD family type I secretion periplasmic adaptor subunit n=1 Tax=Aeromonas TaxID=642 RepID=UPI00059BE754|nr:MULTISPECIES: HlyD family type I secretion periplasmic adaptor subunit [Aeromonas]MXQ70737.1 HlyD family type I secretion periplasmic adaptor subunit [Aeromonas caviae]